MQKIKDFAIRTEKEIRLADKKGPSEEKPREIFHKEEEEKVHFCLFDKEEGIFTTRSLAEVKSKVVPNKGGEQIRQKEDITTEPDDTGYENTNRGREDYDETPFVHQIPMESYVQSKTAVKDPREQHDQFVTKLDNVKGNMHRMKIEAHHGHIVPPECVGEIRSRQKEAHNPGELIVPQPRGHFKESSNREMLLNTEIPQHIGVNDPTLMPRSPLRSPATWPDHPRPGADVFLEKERSRLQDFRMETGKKSVTFGQAAQGTHGAEFEEERTDPSAEHTYEEIPENSDTDMSTPRSRLRAQVPVRQTRPHKIVLNYATEMRLPGAFNFPPPNPSHFNFQQAPAPLSIRRPVPIEDPVLDVSSSEEEEGWEDDEVENDEEEVDWSIRNFLGPRFPLLAKEKEQGSYEKDKDELKELIDRELQVVHKLEQKINHSKILEGIYADNKCTLLDQPQIACAYTNPDLLSNNPKERIEIMNNIYEKIRKAKEDRVTVLKRLEEAEKLRRSKRLLTKPKRRYDQY